MGKTSNDESYDAGFKAGKSGDALGDIAHDAGKVFNTSKRDEIYDKGYEEGTKHRYDSNSGSGGGSGGGCYITTACMDAMGLPDDCYELRLLRSFRNKLNLTEKGKQALKDYDKTAPAITDAINSRHDARGIWRAVYQDIRKAASLVAAGDLDGAFEHYKQVTQRLKRTYLG